MAPRFRVKLMQPVMTLGLVLAPLLLVHVGPALGQETPRSWTDAAELSFVSTTGNAEVSNLAFSNKFAQKWSRSELTIDAAALNSKTTTRLLTNPDGTVRVTRFDETTAEAYNLNGKYRQSISDRAFAYTTAGWLRNRFSGIDNRYFVGGGAGYRFIEPEPQSLAGELGVNYTDESQVGGGKVSGAEGRAFLGYDRTLSPSSKLTSEVEVFDSFENTEDLRVRWVSSVTASVTKVLALKVSFGLFYDRLPVEVVVPGDAPGIPDARFRYDEIDTALTASLVLNF